MLGLNLGTCHHGSTLLCALNLTLACWNAAKWLLVGSMILGHTCQNEIVALQCFLMRAPAKRVFQPLSALQWDIICNDSSLNHRNVSSHTAHVIPLTTSALIDQLNIEWQIALTCHTGLRMLHCWFPPVDMKNIFWFNKCLLSVRLMEAAWPRGSHCCSLPLTDSFLRLWTSYGCRSDVSGVDTCFLWQ